jgi:NADPH:quinone reductase-like Zn-dependent oxidoreductase
MKAIVYTEYGTPDVLRLKEVDTPTPNDNEVLIEVRAVSVNSSDWEFLTGRPSYIRAWGLLKPKIEILGSDVAGKVESVGKNVTRLKQGDAVFGDIFEHKGGFAEYVCAPESALMLKPASLTFEQAAALPQAAMVALQGLRDKGRIASGQKILINGAGGGAGTFAVQIAKSFGAEVTGVDSTHKLDMMRSIGADRVVDYQREDFTRNGLQYDLIVDFVASHSIFDYGRALSRGGRYVMVGGSVPHIFQALVLGRLISMIADKEMGILGYKPNKGLDFLIELIESGKVVPIIDKQFPLSEVPEALGYLGAGNAQGKVVITMEHSR